MKFRQATTNDFEVIKNLLSKCIIKYLKLF